MRSTTSKENSASLYGAIAIPLAALTTFVIGYTISRANLAQTQPNEVQEDVNIVIPHQATMWSDFGG